MPYALLPLDAKNENAVPAASDAEPHPDARFLVLCIDARTATDALDELHPSRHSHDRVVGMTNVRVPGVRSFSAVYVCETLT